MGKEPKRITVTIKGPSDLVFPASAMGKGEIETRTVGMLSTVLSTMSPTQAYLALKQVEHAVKFALGELKEPAIEEVQTLGAKRMEVSGHKLELKDTTSIDYGLRVRDAEARHKLEIDVLKAQATADGVVTKTITGTTIAVTLKP